MNTYIPYQQVGISTNIIDNPENVIEGLQKYVPEFKTVEIEIDHSSRNLLEHDKAQRHSFVKQLNYFKEQHQLYFSLHAPYLGRSTDISATDESTRLAAVALMMKTMNLAHDMGITLFTCHPGYLDQLNGYSPQLFINLRKSLDVLSPYASKRNIKICLENTGDERPNYIVLSDQQHKKLCEEYGVALTLDLIHYTSFNKINDFYYARLKDILPYVKNIHFADMSMPKHAHLPLGQGDFPYDDVLNYVYKNGYQGNVIIEERGGKYKPDQYIACGKQYLGELGNHTNKIATS